MARILVIDDDYDLRQLAKVLLEKEQHEVVVAQDAFEAMDYLDMARFDLVICDINMPKKNGFSLVQELRRGIRNRFLNITFLSARTDKNDIKRAIDIGADGYIVKPIVPTHFLEQVNKLLKKSSARSDLDLVLPEGFEDSLSRLTLEIKPKVLSISDLGLKILITHGLCEGDVVQVDSIVFSQVGVKPPLFVVNSVKKVGESQWQCHLIYRNATYETLQAIHHWITKQKTPTAS